MNLTQYRIMSSGNKNSSFEEKLPPECYQEDAHDYDCFGEEDEEDGPDKTHEEKLQMLEERDNQRYCPWKLEEVYEKRDEQTPDDFLHKYKDVQFTTPEKLEQQIKEFEQLKKQMEYKEQYESSKNAFNDTKEQREENKDGSEK